MYGYLTRVMVGPGRPLEATTIFFQIFNYCKLLYFHDILKRSTAKL